MSTLAIIDYGSGNVRSVQRAIESAAAHGGHTINVTLTSDPETIARADRIVLPGVGHYADCAEGLAARTGVIEAISEAAFARGRPFLGVCVGMQLMADVGREDIETPGLGWIGGAVELLAPNDPALPIPHMGWNVLRTTKPHPLLEDLGAEPHVYFVHSYALTAESEEDVAAVTDYGGPFVAAVARNNLFGAQFHPEKSQQTGQRLLSNFLSWRP
ncbi:MAG: imidazole glycerol phosphate synthase subunit HisH [Alphaproteobacteria bacterium]|nr:imidazole glycerol phosphate synthase subunit HisH [Alphaproteobacteria bacterium]